MVYGQNYIGKYGGGQYGTDKMVRIKKVPIKSSTNLSIPFPLIIWISHLSRFNLTHIHVVCITYVWLLVT